MHIGQIKCWHACCMLQPYYVWLHCIGTQGMQTSAPILARNLYAKPVLPEAANSCCMQGPQEPALMAHAYRQAAVAYAPHETCFQKDGHTAARAGSANTRAPISRSEWPPMNLVTECMTTSAPSSSGLCNSGVVKVQSTTTVAPTA